MTVIDILTLVLVTLAALSPAWHIVPPVCRQRFSKLAAQRQN